MELSGPAKLVRIYISETEKWHGQPLYEAIIHFTKEEGIAGATVLRGIIGYGADSRIQSVKLPDLSTDLPLVVEIVDSAKRIATILPALEAMVTKGLITVGNVQVWKYARP